MADELREWKPRNRLANALAGGLKSVNAFAAKPFGYDNPPGEMLVNALALPQIASTLERYSYGQPLTNAGKANVPMLPSDTADALMAVAPAVAKWPKQAAGAALGLMGAGADAGATGRAMLLFHGSKAPLDGGKFNLDRVGSGTGANTEGWGAYFSLDKRNAQKFGKNINKVDIPDDVAADVLIDWDKPISQQSEKVKSLAALYEKDLRDPKEAAYSFFQWQKSLGRMDTEKRKVADALSSAIYQENGKAKLDIDRFKQIAAELSPRWHARYVNEAIGAPFAKGEDLYKYIRTLSRDSGKSTAGTLNGFGIGGHLFDANRDLHNTVLGARNAVIHDQNLIDRFTVSGGKK